MRLALIVMSFIILWIGNTTEVSGQTTDIARIEYTYFPQADSDNSFRRFRSFVNIPLKLNDKGAYLIPGVEYRNVNFKYEDNENFNTYKLDRFHSFKGNLAYTFKLSEDWRFAAEAGVKIASNLTTDEVIDDDFIYEGSVYFVKIKEDERYVEPWRLILGLNYSTTTGFPFPLPIVNYYKRFHPNWSYTVGTPKSNLKHYFNDKHAIQTFVTLDGFFANIQENFRVQTPENGIAESISMTIVLSGVGYEYNFTDHISFYTYAGYTLRNDIRLRDKDMDDLYTINKSNTFYARGGLKFSIL
ncbi:DUF6268 family outer membrane beta-barrel protein [Salegentibacter sp.]|uniref:DUF6268 family outer membrane beta-barrel protein n=1 Tax=Salegentibacter sp. TaxID=1903072 RepID=UPI003569145A